MEKEKRDFITGQILDASIEVHRHLGPGLLESTYEICLMKEFQLRGIVAERQVRLPIKYKEYELDQDYRVDILVEKEYIIELKAVEIVLPIHHAQIITYLRLANKRIGFLINFIEVKLINGFRRIIQG